MRRDSLSFLGCVVVTCAIVIFIFLGLGQNAMGAEQTALRAAPAVAPAAAQAIVPQLIKFSGTLTDLAGKPISGPIDVTFSLYSQESGGTPLWYESQTVNANAAGQYTTLLGAMTATGVPMDLFTSGQARWLGVAVRGLPEQSRVLLVSVPYAMTSGNAEMLGGKPASDYLLASQSGTSWTTTAVVGTTSTSTTLGRTAKQTSTASPQSITTGGTTNYLAAFSNNSGGLGNSIIYQDPTTNDIGIGTNAPLASTEIAGSLSTPTPSVVLDLSRGYNAGLAYMSAASFLLSNPKVGTNNSRLDIALQNFKRTIDVLPDTTVMSLVSNGNVGIGTTNPLAKSEVMGTPSTSTPSVVLDLSRAYNAGVAYTSAASFLLSNPHVGTNNSRLDIALQNANRAYDALPDTTVMSLVSNGNVGIGTTSPTAVLDVATSDPANTGLVVSAAGGKLISGQNNGTEEFRVDSSGSMMTNGGITSYSVYASGGTTAVTGISSYTGVHGRGSGAGGTSDGYLGTGVPIGQASYAAGVYGISPVYGVYGTGSGSGSIGVYGTGSQGVYGTGPSEGVVGQSDAGYGVYGTSTSAAGVYGASSSDNGVYGYSNSSHGVFGQSGYLGVLGNGTNYGVYGQSSGYAVYSGGAFAASGTKSAVVALSDNRVVELYATEAPEVWFEDFGTATLRKGVAEVTLDPTYVLTVNTRINYHVFLTPRGDCNGLYVTQQTPGGFQVRELQGGKSNVSFDYRIVAKRRGFETVRLQQVDADPNTVVTIRSQNHARASRPVLHVPRIPAAPVRFAAPSGSGIGSTQTVRRAPVGVER